MAKSKQLSSKSVQFAKGGSSHMFGKTKSGTQKPGTSAGASRKETKWPGKLGGSGKMFGKTKASPQKPGKTSKC